MPAFERILVANRGEIACRILSTVQRLGIGSVAVFSEADRSSPHVDAADVAVCLGDGPTDTTYLDAEAILRVALETGAEAVHPGYGFLSENAAFAEAVEEAGLVFVGPTPEQIHGFGAKHTARSLAGAAGVPMLVGSDLLANVEEAIDAAQTVGYPVVLKSSAGGGGIGMEVCASAADVRDAFDRVRRAGVGAFGSSDLYLEHFVEHARHVEVQVFGDGTGRVLALGDRDCSTQRRRQKVIEEAPAADVSARAEIAAAAVALAGSVAYRSAGTVEFVVDADTGEHFFLEVNTRLQVEHTVTEEIHGIDLVEWMICLAAGDTGMFESPPPEARWHAIQARLYAERPTADFLPSTGLLTNVAFPEGVRVDAWVRTGTEVTPHYDPLLAKVTAVGPDRAAARRSLATALASTRLDGIETNLGLLRSFVDSPAFGSGEVSTTALEAHARDATVGVAATVEVLEPGRFTTVQDLPGRVGYWAVGVPPSGPMDDRSFRLANGIVGNPSDAAGIECTIDGPVLRFSAPGVVCVGGADMGATLDGVLIPRWEPVAVPAGGVLALGPIESHGCRTYVAVRGGLDVPEYLGSRSTFTLGGFGGHGGRTLRAGDVVPIGPVGGNEPPICIGTHEIPELTDEWEVAVSPGPHGAPDYFTDADIETFYEADWEVHHNSARTGVRLVGPKPRWAREDGGEAGLHPSNIHDNAYAVGTVDFTGDMPVVLGPDGPSLGGFVCPATVVASERWKLGQLSPGDRLRFVRTARVEPVLARAPARRARPTVTYRRAGDEYLLVEFGADVLDFDLRLRAHALATALSQRALEGVLDLTEGIRSLQVHVDTSVLDVEDALEEVVRAESALPDAAELDVASRIVHLPLSWDDPATTEATRRYMSTVRDDAPWCPHNLEFIRRINGLDSIDDVHRIVFDASYLVLGLGDVYLGAPVATPIDPRHRLVTTKYNPARTWTPENAVGIGGAYLCIYGMEGPGGYQFVGRTVPVWNTWRSTDHFEPGRPWLLRLFDQIRWFEVGADELLDWRRDLLLGRVRLDIEETTFSLPEHHRFLESNAAGIHDAAQHRKAAFDEERSRWEASGEFERADRLATAATPNLPADDTVPEGAIALRAPTGASVWQLATTPGAQVGAGTALVVLEAMKMETTLSAPADAWVVEFRCAPGDIVAAGQILAILEPVGRDAP